MRTSSRRSLGPPSTFTSLTRQIGVCPFACPRSACSSRCSIVSPGPGGGGAGLDGGPRAALGALRQPPRPEESYHRVYAAVVAGDRITLEAGATGRRSRCQRRRWPRLRRPKVEYHV